MISNLRDSFKLYKKLSDNPVNQKEYLTICADYNKFLMSKVLKGFEVTLPSRLGSLRVVGRKQKIKFDKDGSPVGLAPDWVKTKKLREENEQAKKERKIVYHLNLHTSGFKYKFFWTKKDVLVGNKTLYSLRMTRNNKRDVHKQILAGTDYKTI